jgi:hypothetical protein
MDKKNVALLVNATNQAGWIHEVALWLSREEDFRVAALIVAWDDTASDDRSLPWTKDPLGTVARLESRMLETRHRAQLEARDLRASLPADTPVMDLAVTRGAGGRVASDAAQMRALMDLRLDVILVLGGPPIRGELSSMPTHGVWMPVHSEIKDQQDVAHAGFWEVYQRADHTTVKLWRLGATEQADELLDMRSFNTELFWLKNRARALSLGNLAIFDTLQGMVRPERRKRPSSSLQIHTAMTRPQPVQWDGATYLARQAWLASSMVMRRAMKRNVRWRIGMCPTGRQEVVTSDAAVMVPPKGRFFADPFVYTRNGQPYIFFEDYYFRERKGKISVATYIDGAFRFLGVVLDLPYHLSFPYIFEYGGDTYMVPETCGNRTIELWKCKEFPLKWELHSTLMDNISAVDTIVFPYGGRWWLFTNIDRTHGQSHCDELFAFHADRPDASSWAPHTLNPIVQSPVKARNAGMILSPEGGVVRCAQSQGFQHYGNGVSLNRIEELTPETYRESDGPVHYPNFLRKPFASMHHWHHHGGHTVFDFAFME